ncbi:thioredoxin domain-containing protein 16-like isoform X2 [Macrobrachium nipponense]|uniref:thioredoxin domain-containing protein 16-like isoform X2 n=1 Tax=Macrobrachium nipponense TaxID=159736 RepID=UPI0030C8AF26
MSVLWLLLVCQCAFLGKVLSSHQELRGQTDDPTDTHQTPDSFHDIPSEADVTDDVLDRHSEISHFSKPEEEVCLSPRNGQCEKEVAPPFTDNGEGMQDYPGQGSGSGAREWKIKSSGWFSDWELPFSGKEEVADGEDNYDENSYLKKESSVKVLHQKGDFERFLRLGHVVIVFFYKDTKVSSEALHRFLIEYDISSDHLLQYGIYLAVADCNVYSIGGYCSSEKVNRFAYGFREGQEKIAFPLDTLFNNNAIVASALHLDLINAVPILQTAGERRELERRCKGRCDIIFSFQRTLGTYEHRMFLEIAHAYQDSYVFAITTYTAGTLGLSNSLSEDGEDVEQRVWVVHCADKLPQQQCVVSHFRHKMLLPELLQFIAALQLPKWHDLDVSPTKNVVITPYDGTSLPWVLLIYDSSCKHRVIGLAPDLAQLLHGSVATITVDLERINDDALESLGLERNKIVTPALAFLHQEQEKAALLNDYDDPLEWVNEQLTAIFEKLQDKEEIGYQPVQALEELLQDDEVVMGMQREETFVNVPPLSGPEAFAAAIKSNALSVIAFYLAWDPVSSMLLQHMNEIVPVLHQFGSKASLHRVNCFDWPKLCDGLGIAGYPELRIYPRKEANVTYNGHIHSESLMKTILLSGNPPPIELRSTDEVERFLALQTDMHQAFNLIQGAAVGIFASNEDSVPFMEAAEFLRSSHLTGRYISKQAASDMCSSDFGCVLVSKPKDLLQPRTVLETGLNNSSRITMFLQHSTDFVLAPLDLQRLSALWPTNGSEGSLPLGSQYLLLFFIPAGSSLPHIQGSEKHSRKSGVDIDEKAALKDGKSFSIEEEIWAVLGRLATEFSEPGFVFSWIKGEDPLAEKLITTYQLTASNFNLVAVNWKHVGENEAKEARKNWAYVYTCPDLSTQAVRPWLISLKEGLLKPSVVLGENDWEPRLPGFDFIKFMMEDEDRDAEDQLMMEMESDLSSNSQRGDDGETLLHSHKEL